jgi:hypothetical protein
VLMEQVDEGFRPFIEGEIGPEDRIMKHGSRAREGRPDSRVCMGAYQEQGRHAPLTGRGKKTQRLREAVSRHAGQTMVDADHAGSRHRGTRCLSQTTVSSGSGIRPSSMGFEDTCPSEHNQ